MATGIQYDLTEDFTNGINIDKLLLEVPQSGLVDSFHISPRGDHVVFLFPSGLTGGQVSVLDQVVTGHNSNQNSRGDNIFSLSQVNIVTTTVFKVLGSLNLTADNIRSVSNVSFLGRLTTGGSYSLRLYDITHQKVLASAVFSNQTDEIGNLGIVTNLPTNDAVLEMQGKIDSSGQQAQVQDIQIYYN